MFDMELQAVYRGCAASGCSVVSLGIVLARGEVRVC